MSTDGYGEYGRNVIQAAEEIFVQSNMSLREFCRQSERLVGRPLDYERMLKLAQRLNWTTKQAAHKAESGGPDIDHEIQTIRRIVYEQIVLSSQRGLVITGEVEIGLVQAALTGLDVTVHQLNPQGPDPQLVNSYMNLLAKSNYTPTTTISAKTPLEKAQDIIREEMENAD